jgi:hypothetical protein
MDTSEPHRKHTSSIVVLTAGCIAIEVIPLLSAYLLSRECVLRVVAQQRIYMSQYIYSVTKKFCDLMELIRHRIAKNKPVEQYQFNLQPHCLFPMFLFNVTAGSEPDNSLPSGAEVENAWRYTSSSQ